MDTNALESVAVPMFYAKIFLQKISVLLPASSLSTMAEGSIALPSLEALLLLMAGVFLLRLPSRNQGASSKESTLLPHLEGLDVKIAIGRALVMLAPFRLLVHLAH